MNRNSSFKSVEHQAAFHLASQSTQRGKAGAPICGARTRTGATCQSLPIREGKGRCLRHAGPQAAREHRARQYQKYLSGKLSAADWQRAEARRAANRLSWEWKCNPWTPGSTIDLGNDESRLRSDLQVHGLDVDQLAPAVADWLRWQFRRTRIDRRDERAWLRIVTLDLPARVTRAGVRLKETETSVANFRPVRQWTADVTTSQRSSKRNTIDRPRAPAVKRGKGYLRPGRPRTRAPEDNEMQELMSLYREHRAIVAPMWEACPREGDKLAVLRVLRDYIAAPNDKCACDRWFALVCQLRAN